MIVAPKRGRGLLNTLINKLPFEAHIPGYRFCGSGTKLSERLARKEVGINPLDDACKEHDIAYSKTNNLSERHEADKVLAERAWERVVSPGAKIGEKIAAYAVTNAMKAKVKLGAGITNKSKNKNIQTKTRKNKKTNLKNKGKRKHFKDALQAAKDVINKNKNEDIKFLVPAALKAARKAVKGRSNKSIKTPRIIPIPKSGGGLPFLIPLFAGLSAIGSLSGGAASIYKAINDVKSTNGANIRTLNVKTGNGLYLRPYKKGMGIFLEKRRSTA